MKLRIQGNSIRFRLLQTEVATLREQGALEESIHFGPFARDCIVYSLELSATAKSVEAKFKEGRIVVAIPRAIATRWADSTDVAIEAKQLIDPNNSLEILIEKDFKCLHADRIENADAFANPRE